MASDSKIVFAKIVNYKKPLSYDNNKYSIVQLFHHILYDNS